jgi:acyl-CoA thioesterase YciA
MSRRLAISVFAMPSDTNSQNSVFGGWLLSHMDLAGLVECKMYKPGRYVTVAIDQMKFVKPVAVGDLVQIFTCVEKIGKSSLTIKCIAECNRLDGTDAFKVTEAYMTFVKVDELGNKSLLMQ